MNYPSPKSSRESPIPSGKDTQTLVLVALSGGVDSAVVLNYLSEKFTRIQGVSHKHWPESKCCTTACIDNCRNQCNDLGIPYHTMDTLVEFTEKVVNPFVESYRTGKTPNPCVTCNQINRFGLMPQKYFAENKISPDTPWKIATGHYARVEKRKGRYVLLRGKDGDKDQSYMLYRLSEEQLSHCLFPLGWHKKTEVRSAAESFNLSAAKKTDSQDICFVPKDYREFLDNFSGDSDLPGEFVDINGNVLAFHRGISYYNRGQRKGIGLSGGPWYVLKINPVTRQIVLGTKSDLEISSFTLSDCVWNLPQDPDDLECEVQVRYHGKCFGCRVCKHSDGIFKIDLNSPSVDVAPGQSAVFYQGDLVLGGGIINHEF